MEPEANPSEDQRQMIVENKEDKVPGRPSPKKRNTKNLNASQGPSQPSYNTTQPDQVSNINTRLEKNASASNISLNSPSSMAVPGNNQNPFKFIEMALTEAKMKIEKMKATPKILESLPDVSFLLILTSEYRMKKRKSSSKPRTSCCVKI